MTSYHRLASLLLALGACLQPVRLSAQVILIVDRFDDPPLGAGTTCTSSPADCSLREAFEKANELLSGPAVQIELEAGTYQLTIAGNNETNNQTGDLNYIGPNDLLLVGTGPSTTVIEQTTDDRVVSLVGTAGLATTRLEGVTLRGGTCPRGGGAILSKTTRLELVDVNLEDSFSAAIGGCLHRLKLSNDYGTHLERVRMSGCSAGVTGGAMYLEAPGDQGFSTILASRFENNWAGSGAGGLLLSNLSLVTVADTVIAGNVVAGLEGDQLARGGGILVHYANAIIERSAFHHNRAGTIPATAFGGGGTQVGEGGALAIINESVVDIDNTTFAHNRVAGATELGAALLVRASTVDLHTSTITDSRAAGRDAVRLEDSAQLELARSLVDGGCSISGATVTSAQANVEVPWGGGGTTCNLGAGDLVVADLGLRPLAIYGGPFGVPTQALLPGSPAAGLVSSASCADEDARSAPRLGLFCDAGAHESSAVAPGPWIFADGFESGTTLAWSSP
jgi:hypothetical protein